MLLAKIIENINIALTALMGNKTRAGLTMLGITIGTSSVILLMTVGDAIKAFVLDEFSSFGSNLVFVFGKASNEVYDQFSASEMDLFIPLTEDDLAALQDPNNLPDAVVVAGAVGVSDRLWYNGESFEPQIAGITPNYLEAYNFEIGLGESLTWEHVESAARVAVVGQDVVEDVFDGRYPVGETIRIADINFEVIGVWNDLNLVMDPEADNIVILPLTTVQRRIVGERLVDGGYPVTTISIKARSGDAVALVEEQVRNVLRETHELEHDENDDFVVFSQNQMIDVMDQTTTMLTLFLAVIAGISLLVGGIGIMNIMLVTVTERTKEIGLRKAVGAQRSDILLQFLIESVTLALIGGVIGIAIAAAMATLTGALVPNLTVQVSASSVLLATGISLLIGVFFGVYPANRAAQLNPIDALRYE
jgi:putative ABC transport system permease protein